MVSTTLPVALSMLCMATSASADPEFEGRIKVGRVVTSYAPSAAETAATRISDIAKARPMPLPQSEFEPVDRFNGGIETRDLGERGMSPGIRGTGKRSQTWVPIEISNAESDAQPEEYGISRHVFTTARVDVRSNDSSRYSPFSPVGKLYFRDGLAVRNCSAAVIKKGVIVTAAHCVAQFGQNRFFTNFQFVPAKFGNTAPFGTWTVAEVFVMTVYLNGGDTCAQRGVVCRNDIATLRMNKVADWHVGQRTGVLAYGWNGEGFNANNVALISQLGYPASHDSGQMMHRTDSEGFVSNTLSGNTVWGSRQTSGSDGGPIVVNLGPLGRLEGARIGNEATRNMVVGVTSWGYTDSRIKLQGASPFTSENIVALVNRACAVPGTC